MCGFRPAFETAAYFNEANKSDVLNNLSPELQEFFGRNREYNKYFNETIQYQIDNKWSSESKEIADLARNYKYKNPNTTWENAKDLMFSVVIDPSLKNNPCLYGVYKKLGQAPKFQNYLQKFDGNFSVANLKLSAGIDSNKPQASAVTYEPINSLIEIKFNPNFLNSPPLNIARTFFHEMLHAEMYRKLLSLSPGGNITWTVDFIKSIKDDYPGINDYYMRYKYNIPAGQQPSSAQHELMAQHSRDIIIQDLKQYDNTQTEEVYQALAWIGLMGSGKINDATGLPPQPTVAWEKIPLAKRIQLLAVYYNFIKVNPPCQ